MAKQKDRLPQFTPLLHRTLDSPAWLALSPYAKALYPALKRRTGAHGAKNGRASMSVREAAEYLGCNKNTAGKAFADLQAKGFAIPRTIGTLGTAGMGNATEWRLPELGTPENLTPTREFEEWQPGHDLPVRRGKTSKSAAKKRNPV